MPEPLSQRRIRAYNRLVPQIASLLYVLRHHKSGPLGPGTLDACNRAVGEANRLFCREPGLRQITLLPSAGPLTLADLTLVTGQLAGAALAFEERHATTTARPAPVFDDDFDEQTGRYRWQAQRR